MKSWAKAHVRPTFDRKRLRKGPGGLASDHGGLRVLRLPPPSLLKDPFWNRYMLLP